MLIGATLDVGFVSSAQAQFTITVRGAGVGRGRINSGPVGVPVLNCTIAQGNTSGQCVSTYNGGAIVTVVPHADPDVQFAGWTGPCRVVGEDCELTMTQSYTITASFTTTKTYTLSVTVNGNGYGLVRRMDTWGGLPTTCAISGSNQPVTCTWTYLASTTSQHELNPSDQFLSEGSFSGDCSGSLCSLRMDRNRTVTATFRSPAISVRTAGGTGSGRVTGGGMSCNITRTNADGTCVLTYPLTSQQTVTLTPTPDAGSAFAGWTVSDQACAGNGTCVITTPAFGLPGTIVTANFNTNDFELTVNGTGAGSVKSSSGGIDCVLTVSGPSQVCSARYNPGALVTLTATPALGWQFGSWGGPCATSTTPTCDVQMSQDRPVTVNFTRTQVSLTIAAAGTGEGKVTSSNPAGVINCDVRGSNVTGTCVAQVPFEIPVTLTAAAGPNTTFEGWSLASCTGTGPCVAPMSGSQTVTATFRGTRVPVTVGGSGNGNGLVTSPEGMACRITRGAAATAGCETSGPVGGTVTLTAVPQDGSLFASWSIASCPASSLTCTVPVSPGASINASFTAPPGAPQLIDVLLLGGSTPHASELDKFGNKNGQLDLGDLIAHFDRTNETISPAMLGRLLELERTQSPRQTPRRGAP